MRWILKLLRLARVLLTIFVGGVIGAITGIAAVVGVGFLWLWICLNTFLARFLARHLTGGEAVGIGAFCLVAAPIGFVVGVEVTAKLWDRHGRQTSVARARP